MKLDHQANEAKVVSESNTDADTVASFGSEWSRFDQSKMGAREGEEIFQGYFHIFPWDAIGRNAEGFDMGCGSGRWAALVAPRVGRLNCIDASGEALAVAQRNLSNVNNVTLLHASANETPLALGSQDFGYSLGVLHHIPDTSAALQACVNLLKPGAPFLLYLYYKFDNRPAWFRAIWGASEILRSYVSRLPERPKQFVTDLIALTVYWPLARAALLVEKLGFNPKAIPLAFYRNKSFYTMRTDSRDRFGTPLEQRFTRDEISRMMEDAGLENVCFSEREPYWCAVGFKV